MIYAGYIGTDTPTYKDIYENVDNSHIEPGFALMINAAQEIGFDYYGFAKVLAILQILLLTLILFKVKDPMFFILIYTSNFFLHYQFNAVRNGLALLIIGFIYTNISYRCIALPSSISLIHYSSLIVVGLKKLAISGSRFYKTIFIICLVSAVLLVWIYPDWTVADSGKLASFKDYLLDTTESKVIYPALLLKLALMSLILVNKGSGFYFMAYLTLVVLIHIVSPTLSRLSDLVLFLAILEFCQFHTLKRYRMLSIAIAVLLMLGSLAIPWKDCKEGGVHNWCLVKN